jgi:phosphonate metabolism protein (transferase hexapeptide repeat family)
MVLINQGEYHDPWRGDGEMGEAPWLHPDALIRNTEVGAWTAIGPRCEIFDSTIGDWTYLVKDDQVFNADIGKFGNIASNVRINPTNHPFWRATLHHFTYRSRSHGLAAEDDAEIFAWRMQHRVTIGHDVWIGHNATLLPGVSVGDGAAIGAGAIVTKDVAPFTIVAGNPARVIRRRVTESVEAALRRMAWWDWDHARLKAALPDFRALDAADFAAKYDPGLD